VKVLSIFDEVGPRHMALATLISSILDSGMTWTFALLLFLRYGIRGQCFDCAPIAVWDGDGQV
jgi:hypothetical protein